MRVTHPPTLILIAVLSLAGPQIASAQVRLVNGIAAKVNGRVITMNEVDFGLSAIAAQLSTEYPRRGEEFEFKLKEAREGVLNELINREIILDEFKQLGVTIPDHAVDQQIKREIIRLYGGDKNKFNEVLRSSRLTMNGYRQLQKEKLIVDEMRRLRFDDVAPPLPSEIREEYNEVKHDLRDFTLDTISFRKIFIPANDLRDPATTAEQQLAKAEKIAKEIKEGKDFAEMAKEHSQDAYAEDGGLQENVPRTEISSEFAAIMFDAKEGQVIGPIEETRRGKLIGYTIAKPTKITYGPAPALSKVRGTIERRIEAKKTSAQYNAWIQKRRDRAMIDIRL